MHSMTTPASKPSQTAADFWIKVDAPGRAPGDLATVGKWQLFVSRDEVDGAWASVVDLLEAGGLGPAAKVSTLLSNPLSVNPGGHVIIVYAADWRDVPDLRRLLQNLRATGLARGWVHFKRDRESTSLTHTALRWPCVSVWDAPPVGDAITTRWLTGKRQTVTDQNYQEIVAAIEAAEH